jgi:proteasome lid subunit RPN8/RPN11
MTVSVRNVAEEDDQYSIDPHEQLRAMMLMGSKWKLVGCCHSHVHVDATPSALDVSLMIPDQLYFIHSVRDEVIRGWEMVGDDVREVVVHVAR